MITKKFLIAISKADIASPGNKPNPALFTTSFENKELTLNELVEAINQGYSYTAQHSNKHRNTDNFIAANWIAVDYDYAKSLRVIKKLAGRYASIIYSTPSHTPKNPRYRVIIKLDVTIKDASIYSKLKQMVYDELGGEDAGIDLSCKDAARVFYGCKDSVIETNETALILSTNLFIELINLGLENRTSKEEKEKALEAKISVKALPSPINAIDSPVAHIRAVSPVASNKPLISQDMLDMAGRSANGFIKKCNNADWTDYNEWLQIGALARTLDNSFDNNDTDYFYDIFCEASRSHPEYRSRDERKLDSEFRNLKGGLTEYAGLGIIYDPNSKQAIDPNAFREVKEIVESILDTALNTALNTTSNTKPSKVSNTKPSEVIIKPSVAPVTVQEPVKSAIEVSKEPAKEEVKKRSGIVLSNWKISNPLEYLVEPLLIRGLDTLIYGESGAGKSQFVVYLCAMLTKAGHNVVYQMGESASIIPLRLLANFQHHGGNLDRLFLIDWQINLGDTKSINELVISIDDWKAKNGSIDVIFIDTLHNATSGMDENSATDMGIALSTVKKLNDYYRAAIVLIHHSNKGDGSARGSSSLKADIPLAIKCEYAKKELRTFKATVEKNHAGQTGKVFYFGLESQTDFKSWPNEANEIIDLAEDMLPAIVIPLDKKEAMDAHMVEITSIERISKHVFLMLELVSKANSIRYSELQDALISDGTSKATASRTIAEYTANGYLIRTVESHKNIYYSLSKQGEALLANDGRTIGSVALCV